jgi:membrane-anchored protein YejM (alkaline phosphatase superfamily)
MPLPVVEGGFAFNKSADAVPYKNDYYNSLHYSDALLKQILDKLQSQGRLENTWVVITGDHAEEFNENGLGYWGHGSNFTLWQTAVPLIVRSPGQKTGTVETRLSLHQDVVPTLMAEALGCTSPLEHYANGTSLYQLPQQRGTVLSSYFTKAYLVDGVVVEGLTGKKYSFSDMKQACKLGNIDSIKIVMEQERQFLR